VFDEIPQPEKVLKRHQNSDDPCIMAWDHYNNLYPIRWIDNPLNQIKGVKLFSKISLNLGYHQVSIEQIDVWKLTFKYKKGIFEWLVMPFGLNNVSTTFMWMMDDILQPFTDSFVAVNLNDILMFCKT
jgi:hypothetical protein